jgi:hypothetical protein
LLLSLSSFLAIIRNYTLRSTYICPQANGVAAAIPGLQFLGFLLDCGVVLMLYTLVEDGADENNSQRSNEVIGVTFLVGLLPHIFVSQS